MDDKQDGLNAGTLFNAFFIQSLCVFALLDANLVLYVQPGLTKIRDTVTLFNLLKRDQGHVFSKFCISIGSICRVTAKFRKYVSLITLQKIK